MPSPAVLFGTPARCPRPHPPPHRCRRAGRGPRRRPPTAGSTCVQLPAAQPVDPARSRPPPPRPRSTPTLHPELAGVQVWLLSWLPDQGTPLHDHGRSAGAFAVVRGTLTERVVDRAGRAGARRDRAELTGGRRAGTSAPHYVHQVTNEGIEPAVSVHVYTPGPAAR